MRYQFHISLTVSFSSSSVILNLVVLIQLCFHNLYQFYFIIPFFYTVVAYLAHLFLLRMVTFYTCQSCTSFVFGTTNFRFLLVSISRLAPGPDFLTPLNLRMGDAPFALSLLQRQYPPGSLRRLWNWTQWLIGQVDFYRECQPPGLSLLPPQLVYNWRLVFPFGQIFSL